jgi:hypothetical protein
MPVSLRLCRIDCRDGNLYVYGPMFMIICQGEAQDQGLFEEERPVCMPKSSGVHHGVVVESPDISLKRQFPEVCTPLANNDENVYFLRA